MTDPWQEAWDATQARIEAHRDFRRLVREVAVAEQPSGAPTWLRQNSLTYGAWMTRGERWPGKRGKRDRAWELAGRMAEELDVYEGRLPLSEGRARVYGAAQMYVRWRLRGPAR
jgi:hypothetical protein